MLLNPSPFLSLSLISRLHEMSSLLFHRLPPWCIVLPQTQSNKAIWPCTELLEIVSQNSSFFLSTWLSQVLWNLNHIHLPLPSQYSIIFMGLWRYIYVCILFKVSVFGKFQKDCGQKAQMWVLLLPSWMEASPVVLKSVKFILKISDLSTWVFNQGNLK